MKYELTVVRKPSGELQVEMPEGDAAELAAAVLLAAVTMGVPVEAVLTAARRMRATSVRYKDA